MENLLFLGVPILKRLGVPILKHIRVYYGNIYMTSLAVYTMLRHFFSMTLQTDLSFKRYVKFIQTNNYSQVILFSIEYGTTYLLFCLQDFDELYSKTSICASVRMCEQV